MKKKMVGIVERSVSLSIVMLLTGVSSIVTAQAFAAEVSPSMKPISVNPQLNAQIPSTEGFSRLEINYKPTSESGIEAINRDGREFVLKKDGAESLSLPCTRENVVISSKDLSGIVVTVPLQTEPGEYSLEIPEGLVLQSQPPKLNETDEDTPIGQLTSAAYSYGFTIVAAVHFQMSPIPGSYKIGELDKFSFVYPEGTVLNVTPGVRPCMMYLTTTATESGSTQQRTIASYYDVSVDGNVLTLTASTPGAFKICKQNSQLEYYYLSIPDGAWTATLDGIGYSIPYTTYSKYTFRESTDDIGAQIVPAPDDSKTFYPEDFREFVLSYPESWTPNVAVGANAGYLKQAGATKPSGTSGYMFGTLKVASIDESQRLMTLKLADPNGYSNNLDQMQTGWYFVSLNMRDFKIGSSYSSAINFDPYYVSGKNELYGSLSVYSNSKWSAETVVDASKGFSGVGISFPMTAVLENADAEIEIYKNGVAIKSIKASECVASNTLIANNQTSGKEWYYNIGEPITSSGNYVVKIPARTFHQTSWGDFYNFDQDYTISIPTDISYTVSPYGTAGSPYKCEGPLTELSFVYDGDVEIVLENGGDPSKITLAFYDGTSLKNTIVASTLSAGGNTVTAHFPAERWLAPGNSRTYRLNVAGGAWSVKDGDAVTANNAFESTADTGAHYCGNYVVPGIVVPAEGSDVSADDLMRISYTSPVQPLNPSFPGYLGSYPYLRKKGETEKLTEYSLAKNPDNASGFIMSTESVLKDILKDGDVVELVLPTPSRVNYLYALGNAQEMVFEYQIKGGANIPGREFDYTVTPDPAVEIEDTDVDALKEISIRFDEGVQLSLADTSNDSFYLSDPAGERIDFLKAPEINDNVITFYPNFALSLCLNEGEYTFVVLDDAIVVEENSSVDRAYFQGCEVKYTVKKEAGVVKSPYTLEPDPAVVLKDTQALRTIRVTFDEAESITVNSMNLINTANLTLPDGSKFNMGSNRASVSGKTLTVPLGASNFPTAEGEYLFTIFANKVRLNMADGTTVNLPATSFKYLVNYGIATGVDEFEIVVNDVEWYDMKGNRIQGVPGKGIRIRVENGNATKVMVR